MPHSRGIKPRFPEKKCPVLEMPERPAEAEPVEPGDPGELVSFKAGKKRALARRNFGLPRGR